MNDDRQGNGIPAIKFHDEQIGGQGRVSEVLRRGRSGHGFSGKNSIKRQSQDYFGFKGQ
jgi:hypothetical protein